MAVKQAALAALALAAAASARLTSRGTSVTLDGVDFFVSPYSEGKPLEGPFNASGLDEASHLVPVTVVAQGHDNVGGHDDLEALFAKWALRDDVWQRGFLPIVMVAGLSGVAVRQEIEYGDEGHLSVLMPLENTTMPSGPYFLDLLTGELHRVFRLYDDFAGAFIQSLAQRPDGRFEPLSAQVAASASLTIGVPSRLYYTPTAEKPLAGVRVGVKDIFDVAGIKRSNGNRAWYGLYPAANKTAPALQNLLDAGAVFVGVQKTSQFANGENPTADYVDYHAPFNPRGDGYQDTSSSSAGAGSSIASYDWLDLALGSDTGDSIRKPSSVQGVFGGRPSRGLVTLDGAMPLTPRMDTPGFLARDPELWDVANKALFRDNYMAFGDASPRYPVTIRTLDFPTDNGPVAQILDRFAADLARFLNATTSPMNLYEEWSRSAPAEANGRTIQEMLNVTYATLISKDQTRLVREPFYRDYAAKHDNRLPFVNPAPLARWAWGDRQPESALDDAIRNKTLFMDWFNQKVLPRSPDARECSSGLILYTQTTTELANRADYSGPPKPPHGFSNTDISGFSECPDSVFPLGEMALFSPVTNHTENFPVTVDVLAAKGCDGLIAKLARDLTKAGILKVPKVGAGLTGGEILMRRETGVDAYGY